MYTKHLARRARAVAVTLAVASVSSTATAQVVLDGTTGAAGALAGPNYAIGADLGRRAGANLFHSFERFGLRTGESATFTGPDGIRNVISRVTGRERSRINGLLRSEVPGADFWFLNPAGVVFGPSARLEVQGSFHVSTADELRFADGARFSASDPIASSFTVAAPEAFGFLRAAPVGLLVDRSRLSVPPGEALSLIGGDVTITAGNSGEASGGGDGTVRAEAGRITLAALGGSGAAGPAAGEIIADAFADIHLTDQALVDARGDGGGVVRIRGGQFVVENRSRVFADNTGPTNARGGIAVDAEAVTIGTKSLVTVNVFGSGAGGDIDLDVGRLELRDDSQVAAVTFGPGAAGTIDLDVGRLELRSRAQVAAVTHGPGDAGNLTVKAREVVAVGPTGNVSSGLLTNSQGTGPDAGAGGSIHLDVGRLELRDGAQVAAVTHGPGDAGNLTVKAREVVAVGATGNLPSGLVANSQSTGPDAGAGGDIALDVGRIELRDGAQIISSAFGPGVGGDIALDVGRLELRDGGQVGVSTFGPGAAGDLTVIADEVAAAGVGGGFASGLFANSQGPDAGDAGDIALDVGRLELQGGAQVVAGTRGPGDAGNLTVEAREVVAVGAWNNRPGGLVTGSEGRGPDAGDAGDIALDVGRLELRDSAAVVAGTLGPGDAGNLTVEAREVVVAGAVGNLPPSSLFANSQGRGPDAGDAGDIDLNVGRLELRDGGQVVAATFGPGAGGDIDLDVGRLELQGGALVTAATFGPGAGGSIDLDVGRLELRDGAQVAAGTSGPGAGGTLMVVADAVVARSGSGLVANSEGRGPDAGDAGDIALDVGRLELQGGAQVVAVTRGPGDAGDITVMAEEVVAAVGVDGGLRSGLLAISAGMDPRAGFSGTIRIIAPAITLGDGATVATSRLGGVAGDFDPGPDAGGAEARPGSIVITADALRVSGGALVTAETTTADAGDITVSAGRLIDLEDSAITTSAARGTGSGGNIFLNPRSATNDPGLLVLDGGRVVATAREGAGGSIRIVADNLIATPDSVVDASSDLGIDGTVAIEAPEQDVSGGLVALPASLVDASALLPASCAARRSADLSSFTAAGRGGLPPGPDGPLPGFYALGQATSGTETASPLSVPAAPSPPLRLAGLEIACRGSR